MAETLNSLLPRQTYWVVTACPGASCPSSSPALCAQCATADKLLFPTCLGLLTCQMGVNTEPPCTMVAGLKRDDGAECL